jgi:uncharacterized membrane protein YqjE
VKPLAVLLAVVFFAIGLLYGLGKIQWFTQSGTAHPQHIAHLVVFWVLALLCLIWARFQGAPSR